MRARTHTHTHTSGAPVDMEQVYGNLHMEAGRVTAQAIRLAVVVSGSARGTDQSTWKAICLKWEAALVRLFVDEQRYLLTTHNLNPKP